MIATAPIKQIKASKFYRLDELAYYLYDAVIEIDFKIIIWKRIYINWA